MRKQKHMGRVVATIKLTNYVDQAGRRRGWTKEAPRSVKVEALVDTGATELALKPSVIKSLGLESLETARVSTAAGPQRVRRYGAVKLELMGRYGIFDVAEVPERVPNLLGQVPLEVLDLVVDCRRQRLIGNPEHGGVQTFEMYLRANRQRQRRRVRGNR
ncbi:MAG: aspartyl protease family protein [Verrucomicrobia bacterium]|nr:aspartyl protease family protein [Verrucomicrobiota bacterium]